LMQAGPKLGRRLDRSPLRHLGREPELDRAAQKTPLEDHVVVVGYGVAGRWLVRVLKDTGIPFVIIELNPQSVKEAHIEGLPILYGDASRLPILQDAYIARAKLCAIVINDPVAVTRIVQVARHENPTLQIMARTRFLAETEALQAAGADLVVPEELETAVRIFSEVLGAYQVPSDEIARYVRAIRADDYDLLKNEMDEAHLLVLQGLSEEGMHTRAVAVRVGALAEGKTLSELGLRARYGLTVLTVHRDGKPLGHPPGDYRVRAGDRLVLIGSSDQFAAGAPLFREPVSSS
ncbi:MAG TPA: NAD-binding protein, partial [Rhodothermales bacterium]|nr:NAD-binding protein [Rhodothermales bacterium]